MLIYFIPLYVLGALLLLFGALAVLGRFRRGRYLRPIVVFLTRVPLLKRLIQRATRASLERHNPELASALRKLERVGAHRDPQRAQTALSGLTAEERRAWLQAADQQGTVTPSNRAERRAMQKMQRGKMPTRQQRRQPPR